MPAGLVRMSQHLWDLTTCSCCCQLRAAITSTSLLQSCCTPSASPSHAGRAEDFSFCRRGNLHFSILNCIYAFSNKCFHCQDHLGFSPCPQLCSIGSDSLRAPQCLLSLMKRIFLSREGEDDAHPSAQTRWEAEVKEVPWVPLLLLQVSKSTRAATISIWAP